MQKEDLDQFIAEKTAPQGEVRTEYLWKAYVSYATEHGIEKTPSQRDFTKGIKQIYGTLYLTEKGETKRKANVNYFVNISLIGDGVASEGIRSARLELPRAEPARTDQAQAGIGNIQRDLDAKVNEAREILERLMAKIEEAKEVLRELEEARGEAPPGVPSEQPKIKLGSPLKGLVKNSGLPPLNRPPARPPTVQQQPPPINLPAQKLSEGRAPIQFPPPRNGAQPMQMPLPLPQPVNKIPLSTVRVPNGFNGNP